MMPVEWNHLENGAAENDDGAEAENGGGGEKAHDDNDGAARGTLVGW